MSSHLGSWEQPVDLIRELVSRELRLRYRRSVLGMLWSQLAPLAMLIVLMFVFTRVVPLGIDHYGVFILIGILAWTWFSAGLVAATESVVTSRDLVRRPGFRSELLPAVAVTAHLVHLLLALPVLVVAVLLRVGPPDEAVIALPAIIVAQYVLTTGPAYLLAAWHVRYRDIGHLVNVTLPLLFWATPVFYDASSIPERLRAVYAMNPMVHIIAGYRAVLLDSRWPDPIAVVYPLLFGTVCGVVGLRVYRRSAHRFAEEL